MLRIGISASIFHPDPNRPLFKGKTLLYLEESLVHWLFHEKVLGFMIPTVHPDRSVTLKDLIGGLDGVILQGGADVAPETYGEKPLKKEWSGDAVRDRYEMALVRECLHQNKPILGICRGAQLLNVAFGGTLYQDIATQNPKAIIHRDWEVYDQNFHSVKFEGSSYCKKVFQCECAQVNSIHHQAVKDLGKGLVVEAVAEDDGMVEAIRAPKEKFVFGFQWHPEFHDLGNKSLLDCRPLLKEFLAAARV
jgi:gamma-glutamyl-gamma-aminobutyrate hydrolase PuuD